MVQPECYEATRILFVRKENKNNGLIQQFLLFCVSLRHTVMRVLRHEFFFCFFLPAFIFMFSFFYLVLVILFVFFIRVFKYILF